MKLSFTKFYGINRRCCNVLLLIFCLISSVTFAEGSVSTRSELGLPPKTVTGIVKDQNEIPLPGVSVRVKGSNQGTVTDVDGKFTINVPEGSNVLVISFLGFQTQEISTDSRSSINVSLREDVARLDEVLVIGYGTQSRDAVTTSISKLDKKVLENVPYTNLATAMQGTLAGVRVQTPSGQPGSAPQVIVRGGTSINNPNGAAPLYIVDGVIRPQLNDISADDVESMQVLKDAAATAIYGARGSNGVVIVTTKSGVADKTQFNYTFGLTSADLNKKYEFVNPADYVKFFRLGVEALARKIPARRSLLTGLTPGGTGNDLTNATPYTTQYLSATNQHKVGQPGWGTIQDPLDPTKTILFKGEDWQDILFRTGMAQNHYVSARGGTKKSTFNVGAGILDNDGIAIGTDYQRLSLDIDGDIKIKDNMSLFGRLLYSNSAHQGDAWPWDRGHAAPPTLKYKFEDGTLAPGDYYPSAPYQLSRRDQKNSLDNMTLSVGGHWEILPGLSFDPQVSVYEIDSDSRSFQKSLWTSTTAFNTTRSASGSYSKYKQKQADAVFSYRKSVKQNHNIEAMGGFSYFGTKSSGLSASGRGASTDLIPTLNAASEPVSVSGSESEELILGYFSRVNYDYKQKYLISLNGRYDGASKLGDTNKWGFFPGISLGWNVDKEKFWKMFPENLLQLKLRGSYGVNGNLSGLGAYQAQGQYSVGSRYGGNAAIQNTILANQNLQWEQSKTLDFGLDLGLFDQRLGIIFDVYRRETENLLTSLILPQATGFSSVFTNYGSLENKGVELELNAQVLPATSAFKWNVAFNLARNKNKILKLPENGTENNRVGGFYVWDASRGDYSWLGGLQEGGNIGDWYAYKQVGVYSTDAEAAAGPLDMIVAGADKSKYGGDVNWQDLDNNKVIDARDRVYVGNPYPLWTGGFSNTLSFKNFNLGIRLDYATGHTIYNWSRAEQLAQYGAFGNVIDEVLHSWQKQGDITDVPRYYWADQQGQMNIARGNSRYYEKGDYLALREVTLSYNLPAKLLQKVKINSSRIYVTGNNLHYFTAYKGLSPEVGRQDNGNYPIPRNLIVGANISF